MTFRGSPRPMRTTGALALLVAFAAACGGATVVTGALDAASDAETIEDASLSDDASLRDAGLAFEASIGDALTFAQGQCDPPCAVGEYCFAFVTRGGGHHNVRDPADGGDASIGCHAVPAQCAPTATCACLVQVVGPSCHASTTDCMVDDSGRPTVECVNFAP